MKKLTLAHAIAYLFCTFSLAMCTQAQTVTALASFDGQIAFSPVAPVQAIDGNFYGVATGGILDDGLIYQMTPAGSLSSVHRFCSEKPRCADGKDVFVSPILGSDGNLYGVTAYGGSADTGVIYRMSPEGEFTVIYNICPTNTCPDGTDISWLIEGSDGNFYGATFDGGNHNDGEVFRVSPSGVFKLLARILLARGLRGWGTSVVSANRGYRRKFLWSSTRRREPAGRRDVQSHPFGDVLGGP